MPKKAVYRLEPLVKMKDRAQKRAELALARALERLKKEKEKLKELEKEKEKIILKRHRAREEMRRKVASGSAKIVDSNVHLNYQRKLEEDEKEMDKKIDEQKEVIKTAEEHVRRARRDYINAAQEHNVMKKHRELWHKKQQKILSALEGKLMNELGNTIHQLNKMRE